MHIHNSTACTYRSKCYSRFNDEANCTVQRKSRSNFWKNENYIDIYRPAIVNDNPGPFVTGNRKIDYLAKEPIIRGWDSI